MPPPAFYERVTELFRAFEAERKAKGWPEFVCCPIDEVDASCKEFGVKVYAALKAAGVRTYATKDPSGADAADYAPYLDVWCSQPYSVPFDRIVSQTRYEYWCYPNHNAGEIKDRRTMCKGGRMTYGFGLWRSGYTTLIPWHWCWPSEPDPFDYLRGRYSGCGQRVDDEGEVIPAVVGVVLDKRTGRETVFEFPTACPECGARISRAAGSQLDDPSKETVSKTCGRSGVTLALAVGGPLTIS
jgi:hypothetical protein